jgi:D-glucosaminate-6-phosphate ammonia-lyase
MTSRRRFLAGASGLLPLSMVNGQQVPASNRTAVTKDYYHALGVKSFINAVGPYSSLGGARMWPEVVEAMDYAIANKARMSDLHDAVGKRIAELTGAESAMVSAGATSAIILATAGCMAMGDEKKMLQLPNTDGMKNEVIIQKSHRYMYDRAIRTPGAKLIEVESVSEFQNAIGPKTAMLFFFYKMNDHGAVKIPEFIALGKKHNIPTFCDAATTVPPVGNILKTVAMGFDLVCYSGGKGLRGPYSAGLLLGRKDLIAAASVNGSPHHKAFGRSMKVAPEEYLGMMVALEKCLGMDEEAEFNRQLKIVTGMSRALDKITGVTTRVHVPESEAREPTVSVSWQKNRYKVDEATVKKALREGEPAIEIRALFLSEGRIDLTAVMLKPGEDNIIVSRIADILKNYA